MWANSTYIQTRIILQFRKKWVCVLYLATDQNVLQVIICTSVTPLYAFAQFALSMESDLCLKFTVLPYIAALSLT